MKTALPPKWFPWFIIASCFMCARCQTCGLDCQDWNLNILTSEVNKMYDFLDYVGQRNAGANRMALAHTRNLDRKQGYHCRNGLFSCYDTKGKCIPMILVCDGSADCPNARDEGFDTCDFLPELGSIYKVDVVSNGCMREHQKILLDIHGYEFTPWFIQATQIRVIFSLLDTVGGESFLFSKEMVVPFYHNTKHIPFKFENVDLKFIFQPEDGTVRLEGARYPYLNTTCYTADGMQMCRNCIDNVVVCRRRPGYGESKPGLECMPDIKAPPKSVLGIN